MDSVSPSDQDWMSSIDSVCMQEHVCDLVAVWFKDGNDTWEQPLSLVANVRIMF